MLVRQNIIWTIYILLICALTIAKNIRFFNPASAQFLYYQILIAFDPIFYFHFLCATLQLAVNTLHIIPLILYVYGKQWMKPQIWKVLLTLRIVFDLTGHSYAMQALKGLYHMDIQIFLLVITTSITLYVPSYIACHHYAFAKARHHS